MSGTIPTSDVVLVAEHDSGLRAALAFLLRVEGYDVRTVDSGEALLTVPLPARDACLVVDQDLPGLSGLQTIEALRSRGVALPVVLLAGRPKDVAWLLDSQARVWLVEKPLWGPALLETVGAALAPSLQRP